MDELKPTSHKQFNAFMKEKGFKGMNNYALKDLNAKFGFKSLVKRRALVVYSKDLQSST